VRQPDLVNDLPLLGVTDASRVEPIWSGGFESDGQRANFKPLVYRSDFRRHITFRNSTITHNGGNVTWDETSKNALLRNT
jgi:hypothetical protein